MYILSAILCCVFGGIEMQYFERIVEEELKKWKESNRVSDHKYALEVTGSRQVGKTTTVLHFAENNYKNVIYVDVRHDDIQPMKHVNFNNVRSVIDKYCEDNGLEYTDDNETIIIFDEIQESKVLFEKIRTFNRGLNCDLIITGSNLQKTIGLFQPAGDLLEIRMYPLSFEEYLLYFGAYDYYYNNSVETICREKLDWFRNVYEVYKVVGGYPSVFTAFLEKRDITNAFAAIMKAFQSEFRVITRDPSDYDKIEIMFETICEVLYKEKKGNKRILDIVSHITEQSKNKRISAKECNNILAWLSASRIINFCDKRDLKTGELYPSERFYFDDIGFLRYICDRMQLDSSTVEGIVAENFIFKQLKDGTFEKRFYGVRPAFAVSGPYELDFFVTSKIDDCRYGIEVKAGNNVGVSARKILAENGVDFIINAKGSVQSGNESSSEVVLPIFLFNKFQFDKGGKKKRKELPEIDAFS